jgi:hypothetical protein
MSFMETNESSEIDAELHAIHLIQGSPPDPSPLVDSPRGSLDLDSSPLVRPPLPPKPAHLNRKVTELRSTDDLYLDDDESDEDGSESDVVQGNGKPVIDFILWREEYLQSTRSVNETIMPNFNY